MGPLPGAARVQVRAAATAVAARAADALTGGACGGCQTELVQRAAFRLLGERCRGSPTLRAHLFRWIYMCAESPLPTSPACRWARWRGWKASLVALRAHRAALQLRPEARRRFSCPGSGNLPGPLACPRTPEALPAASRAARRPRRSARRAPRRPQHGAALPARLGALRPGAPRRLYDRDAARPHAEALLLAQLAAWQLRRMLAREAAEAAPPAGRAGGLEGRPPFAEGLEEHLPSTGSCGGPRPGAGGLEGPAPRAGACGAAAEDAGLPGAPRSCGCAGDLAAATRRWACEVAQARAALCWASP